MNETSRNSPEGASGFRPKLLAIAYRMLGSAADAEDAVQDAYLRLQRHSDIDNPEAWLVKVTTTICIDRLRRLKKRQSYHGPWLPEPVSSEWPGIGEDRAELADSLSMAFLLMLETLSPAERAAYLLREAFDYEFDDIAALLDKSSSNVRQLVTRARGRLARQERKFHPAREEAEKLAEEFYSACLSGDLSKIECLLTDDAILYSDGGGVVHAAPRPVEGRQRVAKLLSVVFRKFLSKSHVSMVNVNGQPGIVSEAGGKTVKVLTFAADAGRVRDVYLVMNPQKLERWELSQGSDPSPSIKP
ncbi:RNA polymerase sigma factor SigJ [Planctomicrobium sp. SH661]|uniref:RNA polymerase sigma factor SigJ n=1 Tax=Planctomicrobium sp. SH661 TaxID=3448124 RepID=UPI003F5B1BE6